MLGAIEFGEGTINLLEILGNRGGIGIIHQKKSRCAQIPHFEGFSNTIQLICTFCYPNDGYAMKKYTKLNSFMHFWQ